MTYAHDTRRDSYSETNRTVVTVSHELFNILVSNGPLTAFQVAALADRPVYTVRPRLTELCKAGKIKEVGRRWHGGTERNETIYEVADKQLGLFNP